MYTLPIQRHLLKSGASPSLFGEYEFKPQGAIDGYLGRNTIGVRARGVRSSKFLAGILSCSKDLVLVGDLKAPRIIRDESTLQELCTPECGEELIAELIGFILGGKKLHLYSSVLALSGYQEVLVFAHTPPDNTIYEKSTCSKVLMDQ